MFVVEHEVVVQSDGHGVNDVRRLHGGGLLLQSDRHPDVLHSFGDVIGGGHRCAFDVQARLDACGFSGLIYWQPSFHSEHSCRASPQCVTLCVSAAARAGRKLCHKPRTCVCDDVHLQGRGRHIQFVASVAALCRI